MEAEVYDLVNAGIAVDLLVPGKACDCTDVGIRLRTYGRNLPPRRMIIATAATFEEALLNAIAKAEDGRWESLNWATRPWSEPSAAGPSRYGL